MFIKQVQSDVANIPVAAATNTHCKPRTHKTNCNLFIKFNFRLYVKRVLRSTSLKLRIAAFQLEHMYMQNLVIASKNELEFIARMHTEPSTYIEK